MPSLCFNNSTPYFNSKTVISEIKQFFSPTWLIFLSTSYMPLSRNTQIFVSNKYLFIVTPQ